MSTKNAPLGDDQTMAAIRSVLCEATEATPPKAKPKLTTRFRSETDATPVKPVQAKATTAPEPKAVAAKTDAAMEATTPSKTRKLGIVDRVREMPRRTVLRIAVCAAILLLIVLRPHVFVIGILVLIFIVGASFATFGSDAVWGFVMRRFERYASAFPQRAAKFAKRMDAVALRWDGFLDRFPDGSVDGLYLPDFQRLSQVDEEHAAAMDRRLGSLRS